ncbi:DUF6918 family protein [Corynebacterium mendelii]|uniref:Uncharacterized protein n=1 Tax=Corynebacterium mendelii TaxID=2765362 RepID=A0A939ITX7_9CORY|nr:hypothetical protein [Corynebacterium mendelii]MBN9644314.1 hypothetical protein [Corynebacterium mendelii]
MNDLRTQLTGPCRSRLAEELAALTTDTIAGYSGITGTAIKATIGSVEKAQPGTVKKGINRMIPDMADALQGFWDSYRANPTAARSFGDYLGKREDEVAAHLVAEADKQSDQLDNAPLKALYGRLRAKAPKYLRPAIGPMGDLVEKYAAQ